MGTLLGVRPIVPWLNKQSQVAYSRCVSPTLKNMCKSNVVLYFFASNLGVKSACETYLQPVHDLSQLNTRKLIASAFKRICQSPATESNDTKIHPPNERHKCFWWTCLLHVEGNDWKYNLQKHGKNWREGFNHRVHIFWINHGPISILEPWKQNISHNW